MHYILKTAFQKMGPQRDSQIRIQRCQQPKPKFFAFGRKKYQSVGQAGESSPDRLHAIARDPGLAAAHDREFRRYRADHLVQHDRREHDS